MRDLLVLLIVVAFFALCVAYVRWCDRIIGPDAPDLSGITAPVLGAFAANDDFFPPDACQALARSLRDQGKDVHFEVYAGTGHAFANEDNPLGSYNEDAATKALNAAIEFLRKHLA